MEILNDALGCSRATQVTEVNNLQSVPPTGGEGETMVTR